MTTRKMTTRGTTKRASFAWSSLCAGALAAIFPSTAHATGGKAQYYGGHVVTHVQVVPVLWGSGVSADVVNGQDKFYATLVDSPYLDWLGEYDTVGLTGAADQQPGSNQHIFRGTALPSVSITPSTTSTSLTDGAIQTELLAQLKAGKLPAPKVDAEGGVDTLYVLTFPAGVKISDFGGQDVCSGGCAYHWTVSVPGVTSGVPYAVIPDCSGTQTQCSLGKGVFDTFTGDVSHELTEAITDPECALDTSQAAARPLAWVDPTQSNGGEIGDMCLDDPGAWVQYQGYLVQTLWSQRLGKCITNDPSLALCDGKTRPCRPCAAADCTGGATCDSSLDSATWGRCTGGAGTSGGAADAGAGAGGGAGVDAGTGASSSGGAGNATGETPPGSAKGGGGGCDASGAGGAGRAGGAGATWGAEALGALAALLAALARRARR